MNAMGTTNRLDDIMTSYSSKGPTLFDDYVKPDIVAPGNQVVSLLPQGLTLQLKYPQNQIAGDHFVLSGTSMATPVVSGAAVLLPQKYPFLTPDQVKARLIRNASKIFPTLSPITAPVSHLSYTVITTFSPSARAIWI
jgi:serine protease AprX